MDNETSWKMSYYQSKSHWPVIHHGPDGSKQVEIPPYRVASFRWSHQSMSEISRDIIKMRQLIQLPAGQPLYVLDGDFELLPSSIPSSQLLSGVLLLVPPAAAVPQLRP